MRLQGEAFFSQNSVVDAIGVLDHGCVAIRRTFTSDAFGGSMRKLVKGAIRSRFALGKSDRHVSWNKIGDSPSAARRAAEVSSQ